jgi:uncharacterized protein YigE (DUF2233 family)
MHRVYHAPRLSNNDRAGRGATHGAAKRWRARYDRVMRGRLQRLLHASVSLMLAASCAAACRRASAPPHVAPPAPLPAVAAAAASPATSGIPGVTHRVVQHAGASWDVFEIDLAAAELRLYGQADPSLRTFASVRSRLAQQSVRWSVMSNAGMFHAGEHPVGLHVENGTQYAPLDLGSGTGNFYLVPNGVFFIDERGAHVVESHAFAPIGTLQLATQSGPLLLQASMPHPSFIAGSRNLATRSAIGVRDASHVVLAVSQVKVAFYDSATLFRDVLQCADALYLDGTISDFDTPQRTGASVHSFGGVLVAVERAPAR